MSEEQVIGPYHDDRCAKCKGPDAAYIVNGQQLCWKHAKPEHDAPAQKRNLVGVKVTPEVTE